MGTSPAMEPRRGRLGDVTVSATASYTTSPQWSPGEVAWETCGRPQRPARPSWSRNGAQARSPGRPAGRLRRATDRKHPAMDPSSSDQRAPMTARDDQPLRGLARDHSRRSGMKDTVSHYILPQYPLTSTAPQAFSNNLTMPSRLWEPLPPHADIA